MVSVYLIVKEITVTIVLNKQASPKDIEAAKEKLLKRKSKSHKGDLSKFFGSLKRGLDGLQYQKKTEK
jgi:hypothetical protein